MGIENNGEIADFVPNALNELPVVMRGCSWPEIYAIAFVGFCVSIPISIGISLLIGSFIMCVPVIPIITSIVFMIGTNYLSTKKNDRPVGYYSTKFILLKMRLGHKTPLVTYSGIWDIYGD